ncbi:DUF2088 domain-containing protein [Candidatus Poribacteria bacterium]|nr:DUF2088 domain-containing protein [Candidatus Poribacteria bacterium]
MPYPRMVRIKQHFDSIPPVDNIPQEIHNQLSKSRVMSSIKPGQSVAITGGSRGVANIDIIIKSIIHELKSIGAEPFVIPAMGSHGGATAEGQRMILQHYNITEDSIGAPVKSSMETCKLGANKDGIPVYIDKNAYEADHIAVVNRIKVHTDFTGKIESGLVKMMAIGLGKRDGAATYHKAALHYGFERVLRGVADVVLNTGKVAFGVGMVENPYDETCIIKAFKADNLISGEEKIQEKAKQQAAKLPFDELDILIVDEAGKEISGTGMDTKVIGRMMQLGEEELTTPKITRIYLRDLTDKSMGNGAGIGFADFTTKRFVDKIDYKATYMNFITSMGVQKIRIPVHFDSDKEVFDAMFETIGMVKPEESRIVRIKNTLRLDEVDISESLIDMAKNRNDLEIVDNLKDMIFDDHGNIVPDKLL